MSIADYSLDTVNTSFCLGAHMLILQSKTHNNDKKVPLQIAVKSAKSKAKRKIDSCGGYHASKSSIESQSIG